MVWAGGGGESGHDASSGSYLTSRASGPPPAEQGEHGRGAAVRTKEHSQSATVTVALIDT